MTEPVALFLASVSAMQERIAMCHEFGDAVAPLATNARAKMQEQSDRFMRIFCREASRIVASFAVVSPHASELIHALTLAVQKRLTAEKLASTFTVLPGLSGSIAEANLRLHNSRE